MYEIGSLVVYGSDGVCKVTEIVENSFTGKNDLRKYYVLAQISNPAYKVFVPCDNEILVSRMQKILSAEEIAEMIKESNDLPEWISDNKVRTKVFKEIMSTYDRKKILALAKLLYVTKSKLADKKKLFASDEELLRKIIRILHSEFSLVYEIEEDQVIPFIFQEIECKIK